MSNQTKTTTGNGSTAPGREETVQLVELADLHISEQNTRQPTPKDVAELALSMKETGQTTPAIVRPHPNKKGQFEIAAGARRLVAAKAIGWKQLAVVVRELDDNSFEELLLVENLQRVDPDPAAEVELIDRLVKRGIHTPEQISAHLGKSANWAIRRVQLLKVIPELRKSWQTKRDSGRSIAHFSVEMMSLLGSLPEDTQKALAKEHTWQGVASRAQLQEWLDRYVFCRLDKAAFDLNDKRTFVPGCGPGCACDSSALAGLFDFEKKEAPRCLKPECFMQRKALATKAKLEEVRGKEDLPVVSNEYRGRDFLQVGEKRVHVEDIRFRSLGKIGDKPEKGAQKVVVVDDQDNVRIGYLPKRKPSTSSGDKKPVKSPEKRREEGRNILQGKRWLKVHEELLKALYAARAKDVTEPIVDLVAVLGLAYRADCHYPQSLLREWKEFDDRKENGYPKPEVIGKRPYRTPRGVDEELVKVLAGQRSREDSLWFGLQVVLEEIMEPIGNVGDAYKAAPNMQRVAKLIGFPIAERKKEADKAIPPPKSWGEVDVHSLDPIKPSKRLAKLGVKVTGKTKAFLDKLANEKAAPKKSPRKKSSTNTERPDKKKAKKK